MENKSCERCSLFGKCLCELGKEDKCEAFTPSEMIEETTEDIIRRVVKEQIPILQQEIKVFLGLDKTTKT